ncbi:MAG: DUF3107 domain-containing protein [Actinomycetaceae bacterium]|nr:DUF3107 domain-containing protein [Actinomycetaceae bacterium]
MQVTIGIRETNRELSLDVDASTEEIYNLVAQASDDNQPLKITDKDGKMAIIPLSSLAYLEVAATENRRVGFGL